MDRTLRKSVFGIASTFLNRFALAFEPESWIIVGSISLVAGATLVLGNHPTPFHSRSDISTMSEPAIINCLGGPPTILATMDRWIVLSKDQEELEVP
jgi:hypothetical protein